MEVVASAARGALKKAIASAPEMLKTQTLPVFVSAERNSGVMIAYQNSTQRVNIRYRVRDIGLMLGD